MLDHISQTITRNCYIDGVSPVLVGVSGGPDSICLLDLLHRLRINLVVAHFHHGIRPDAHFDEELVKRAALSYGIPFVPGGEPVPEFAQSHNLSIEEAARIMRYRFLFEHAESWGCQAVAVAHNADDQVETILMHLLRGSGLVGLKGMTFRVLPNPWSDSIPLIRPFLGTWRSEIETYCTARELVTVLDRTNLDTRLFRNRLRHELIPELETFGLDIEPFGGNTFVVKSIPPLLEGREIKPLVMEMIDKVTELGGGHGMGKILDQCLIVMACHGTVRAKQALTDKEMKALLSQLDACENSSHCPHGRPIWIAWSLRDLEKHFRRII